MTKTILSLYDYSGNWSRPYREAGYNVIKVDIKHGQDARLLRSKDLPVVHGILAAPPCTVFSLAANRWKRADAEMVEGLSTVDAVLRLVHAMRPQWWALENPIGKLSNYLGPWVIRFDPCDYGGWEPPYNPYLPNPSAYAKPTALWGSFKAPARKPVPVAFDRHNRSQTVVNTSYTRAETRSITPLGFSYAFFAANP